VKSRDCLVDASIILDFYRHVSESDYCPDANAIVQQCLNSFPVVYSEFAVGHSRYLSLLGSRPELSKLRMISQEKADSLINALATSEEQQLSALSECLLQDSELATLRARNASAYVRSLPEEIGYVCRLAVMAMALEAVVVVAPHRLPIVQAMHRSVGDNGDDEDFTLPGMETLTVTIAGARVVFTSLLSESKSGHSSGYSLVMRGGGIKGIAYAGALQELERYYSFDTFVGTSAGSIAAAFLAAGWKPSELEVLLSSIQLRQFVSLNPFTVLWNLLYRGGMFSGDRLQGWVELKLREKTGLHRDVMFRDLSTLLEIPVSTRRRGTVVFSRFSHPQSSVSYAVRMSSTIPFFFVPADWEGEIAVDGGVQNNLPVRPYLEEGGDARFLVLTLSSVTGPAKRTVPLLNVAKGLLGIWIDQDEETLAITPNDSIIMIDAGPIKSTQLTLTPEERRYLLESGRLAALKFLLGRKIPNLEEKIQSSQATLQEHLKAIT
jgi:predicted acylesterase/phospholipase RssA